MGTTLVWDHTQPSRARRIPADLEPSLMSILRCKYLDEDLSVPEVQRYIQQHLQLPISERQITHRLTKHHMLKTDHQARSEASWGSGNNSVQSTPLLVSIVTDNIDPTNLDINPNRASPSSHNLQCPLSDRESPLRSPRIADFTYGIGDGQSQQPTRGLHELPSTWPISSREVVSEDKGIDSVYQQSTTGILSHRIWRDDNLMLATGMTVRRVDNPAAPRITSIERVSMLCAQLFQKASWYPNLTGMSVSEVHSSTRLALVMLSCGYNDDASSCLEFLLWRWNGQNISASDTSMPLDAFLHSTNILTWLLQTRCFDSDDTASFALWQSCQTAHESRSHQRKDKHAFTAQHVLAVGRLAIAAYVQGYHVFFNDLRDFWRLHRGIVSSMKLRKSQKAMFEHIGSNIDVPHSINTTPQLMGVENCSITAGIKQLLCWIRKQLHLRPLLLEREGIKFHDIWRELWLLEGGRQLERQILLSYLAYQGGEDGLPWKLSLADNDRMRLPWNICLEWLLGDFPHWTLSILASLTAWTEAPPMVMTSKIWRTRMLVAIDQLSKDIKATTERFCNVARACCPDTVRYMPPGQRILWKSPVELDLSTTSTVSAENQEGQIRHLICSIALFGSAEPDTSWVRPPALAFDSHDPVLGDSRMSSLSGFSSMKSICIRAKNHINLSRTSLSMRSSVYPHYLGSGAPSLFGSLINLSQSSLLRNSWFALQNGPEEEKRPVSISDDAMDIDT